MGILSGAMSVRRFRIEGDMPAEGITDWLRDGLQDQAFLESPVEVGKEEREGWVLCHNLLDTDFTDVNRWLYNDVAVFALRVDKKTLPAKLFKAHLEKRVEAWCEEHGMERCPRSVKDELKERLEIEWLKRALPRVGLTEIAIHLTEGFCIVHSLSDNVAERVRKRFHASTGLKLVPWSPLEFVLDDDLREAMLDTVPSDFSGGA